jgi:uncharacterized protein (DUF305 family)
MSRTIIAAATLAIAFTCAASIASAQDMKGHDHSTMQHAPATDDSASTQAYKAANARMHEGMAIDFSGDADVDFVRGMIAHHQGAIDMAKVELEHGKDPQMRKLAEAVIAAQETEMAEMQAWLAARGL